MGIQTSLDAIANADRLVDAIRLADDLAFDASRDGGARTIKLLTASLSSEDHVVAIAATHALAQVFDEQADRTLAALLSSERRFLREHAAWAIGLRMPRYEAVGRLVGLVLEGGFAGMLAQRTLEQWASPAPEIVAVGIEGALLAVTEPGARARLVETLGLVRTRIATRPLLSIAADRSEDERVRAAAIAALGQRPGPARVAALLTDLAEGDDYLADVARLALVDLSFAAGAADVASSSRAGTTIAQLFLHADIDPELSQAGSGDNGGIATLLVRLGDALVADGRIDRVLTMSRGAAAAAVESVSAVAGAPTGHVYGRIPLLSEVVNSANAWPLRVAARRGIRRMLRAAGGIDVLHLRMADVGSLAASDVARELDIPVVFTVAPDPHAVIQSLDLSGRLTRTNFGEIDEIEHYWYRIRLVQSLASNAAHSVLFPRPALERDMRELVGIDVTARPERHTIVPEGIDLGVVDRAVDEARAHASGADAGPALAELHTLLERLPEERRGLPLLVSVGRFHRVKGMASIVEAWAGSELRDRANLLLIGGDLETPSADEREQLDAMDAVVPAADRIAAGLLLPGHRRNDTVARWVAAARFGVPGLVAPDGVYVCGSLKEEFGIALLEAMATGLTVVAPDGGGPATYVERGVTGFLTHTWDPESLRDSMAAALVAAPGLAAAGSAAIARDMVEGSFTIQAMAESLGVVYDGVEQAARAEREFLVEAASTL